jgi:hypothetical protein
VELSVNLAIRAEFADQSELSPDSVTGMLRRANGLRNKMKNLLTPLVIDRPNQAAVKKLCKEAEKINDARNEIVHSGFFSNRTKATAVIDRCRKFINDLVGLYEANFEIGPLAEDAIEEPSPETKAKAKPKKTLKRVRKSKR